jgi:hypothetical protein
MIADKVVFSLGIAVCGSALALPPFVQDAVTQVTATGHPCNTVEGYNGGVVGRDPPGTGFLDCDRGEHRYHLFKAEDGTSTVTVLPRDPLPPPPPADTRDATTECDGPAYKEVARYVNVEGKKAICKRQTEWARGFLDRTHTSCPTIIYGWYADSLGGVVCEVNGQRVMYEVDAWAVTIRHRSGVSVATPQSLQRDYLCGIEREYDRCED